MYWPDPEPYIIICTRLLHKQEENVIEGRDWKKEKHCVIDGVLLWDAVFLAGLKMSFKEELKFHCACSWDCVGLLEVLPLKRQWAAASWCLSHVNTNLEALSVHLCLRCRTKKKRKKKKNAFQPDELTSNAVVEITAFSYSSLFLGGTIYTSQDRVCAGLCGVSGRGFVKQPDSLRNGNVRYLTEFFCGGSPGFIEFCGLCRGILRPWSDSIQTFRWCSLRRSVWHFDTASIGFVAFQPLACQSIWARMPECEFSVPSNDW